jgi:type I restriction enzyme, S subunit
LPEKAQFDYLVLLPESADSGAAIPHANRKFILDMKIKMPPKKEAKYFDGLTLPIIKLINILHFQNTKLREARDILLPKLMSGR